MKHMDIREISQKASAELQGILNRKIDSVSGVRRDGDNWIATLEVLERKAIPDTQDIISTYETCFDPCLCLLSYRRTGVHRRGDSFFEETEP